MIIFSKSFPIVILFKILSWFLFSFGNILKMSQCYQEKIISSKYRDVIMIFFFITTKFYCKKNEEDTKTEPNQNIEANIKKKNTTTSQQRKERRQIWCIRCYHDILSLIFVQHYWNNYNCHDIQNKSTGANKSIIFY